MGTLSTRCDLARLRAGDTDKTIVNDTQLLPLCNSVLGTIWQALCNAESNLVYSTHTVNAIADTHEYPLAGATGFAGVMADGVWIDGEDWYLSEVSEADKIGFDIDDTTGEPQYFYITEDDNIGFLWVPDDNYTVYVQYFKRFVEMADLSADNLPWYNIWDNVFEDLLTLQIRGLAERDVTADTIRLNTNWPLAMAQTIKRGVRKRRVKSDFFDVEGM